MKSSVGALLLVLIIVLSGCSARQETEDRQRQQLIAEFNVHVDTLKDDNRKLYAVGERYDNRSVSIDERIGTVNEYVSLYKLRKGHVGDFSDFIILNEQALQGAGVDTRGWKRSMQDTTVVVDMNIERMKSDAETMLRIEDDSRNREDPQTMTQQQYHAYEDAVQALAALTS